MNAPHSDLLVSLIHSHLAYSFFSFLYNVTFLLYILAEGE